MLSHPCPDVAPTLRPMLACPAPDFDVTELVPSHRVPSEPLDPTRTHVLNVPVCDCPISLPTTVTDMHPVPATFHRPVPYPTLAPAVS